MGEDRDEEAEVEAGVDEEDPSCIVGEEDAEDEVDDEEEEEEDDDDEEDEDNDNDDDDERVGVALLIVGERFVLGLNEDAFEESAIDDEDVTLFLR